MAMANGGEMVGSSVTTWTPRAKGMLQRTSA